MPSRLSAQHIELLIWIVLYRSVNITKIDQILQKQSGGGGWGGGGGLGGGWV